MGRVYTIAAPIVIGHAAGKDGTDFLPSIIPDYLGKETKARQNRPDNGNPAPPRAPPGP